MKGMLSASVYENATPRSSGGQGRRLTQEAGEDARSSTECGEAGEARENVALTKQPI